MFEWLVAEMAKVRTRKFYLVDGAASADLQEAVRQSSLPVPPSYRDFVLRFGNAELYRQGSIYLVRVYAAPVQDESEKGEALLHFGRTDASLAYFKESLLRPDEESPVFEWRHAQGLRRAADGFEDWLRAKCRAARRRFKSRDWKAIEEGPPPFSDREKAIVEARRLFRWRVVGIAANGDLRFEVHNGSRLILPYLSIGIRGKLRPPLHGPLNGGVWLSVSSVRPGETRIIEKDCYKERVDPSDVEAFELPDPDPEDRDRYWEFEQ
jgi:hypothetical protein